MLRYHILQSYGSATDFQAMDEQGTWRLKMPRLAKDHKFHWFLSKTCPFNWIWKFDRKNSWPAFRRFSVWNFSPRTCSPFCKSFAQKMLFVHKVVHVRLKFLDPMQKNYTQCKLYMSGFPGITSPHDILSLVHKFLFVRLTFLAFVMRTCKIFA